LSVFIAKAPLITHYGSGAFKTSVAKTLADIVVAAIRRLGNIRAALIPGAVPIREIIGRRLRRGSLQRILARPLRFQYSIDDGDFDLAQQPRQLGRGCSSCVAVAAEQTGELAQG
jgi:hypothetical protein